MKTNNQKEFHKLWITHAAAYALTFANHAVHTDEVFACVPY